MAPLPKHPDAVFLSLKIRIFSAIAKTTALEILSEPLSLLVLVAALLMEVLAPAFHYHQFGEPTRMACDAGISALFTCGIVFAVFPTIRAFRREVESGTLEMALAHPVSRVGFFFAKASGALLAYLAFAAIVFATSLVTVAGADIGGRIAAKNGDVARLYGPCFAAALFVPVLSMVVGAALNRFARFRFVLSAFVIAAALSASGAVWFAAPSLATRMAGAAVPVAISATIPLAAAAAFAVRFRSNAAASACGIVVALMLPAFGNYVLSDALSGGGNVPWGYVSLVVAATVPAVAFFLVLGAWFAEREGSR